MAHQAKQTSLFDAKSYETRQESKLWLEEDGWEETEEERRERTRFAYPTDFALEKAKQQVLKLKESDRQKLLEWLKTLEEEKPKLDAGVMAAAASSSRKVVKQKLVGETCYQLEYVKCGKPRCGCQSGKLHGPYWYSYQRINGRVQSRYVGKSAPDVVKNA
ncbi:MAG: hypothetical protein F6J93_27820 [Oscillatoria sp. SIO1A7]|nr:hypothetical protein [Oscillatoria sp. SIO1A7]